MHRAFLAAALLLVAAVLWAAPAAADEDEVEFDDDSAQVTVSDTAADDDDGVDFDDDSAEVSVYDAAPADGAWRESIRLTEVAPEHDGAGVTVAVLDTGVTRHPDLGERVAARVDLTPDGDGYDRYGHGTHMIGVIAGDGAASGGRWAGAAPGASVVPVKLASWDGATDVSAVIAGLEWVAAHHERYGIRVVNLSYGTDSSQKYLEDPLNEAVERLWDAGVLVVVGAGNAGDGGSKIEKPGDDPLVLTVGAAYTRGTAAPADDEVAAFSSHGPTGEGIAKPDLIAPGVSIVSHRSTGSTVDELRPRARLDEHYFKGTGTSQAAAVVSGVAARMFDAAPAMTPDEAKAALVGTAAPELAARPGAGAGLVDANAAVAAALARSYASRPANQGVARSSGLGKIDSSRGSVKPYTDWKERGKPEQLSGEYDALGQAWDGAAWAAREWSTAAWASSPWARYATATPGWSEAVAPAETWRGLGWDEESWNARSWGARSWGARSWGARSWGARSWGARSWGSALWNG
jgi:serine protease AprX